MGWFTSSKVKKLERDLTIIVGELIKTKKKVSAAQDEADRMYRAAKHLNRHNDQLIAENKRLKRNGSGLTQAQIRAAIRFCHPDKHNNSKAATELTVTLLELRK